MQGRCRQLGTSRGALQWPERRGSVLERPRWLQGITVHGPAFIERARAIGMESQGGSPADMEQLLNAEIARWNPVVKSLNLPKAGQ